MDARCEYARRIAMLLNAAADNRVGSEAQADRFHKESYNVLYLCSPPMVSLPKYIVRLIDYMYCSPECFVIAAILALRLTKSGVVPLGDRTQHRLMGACCVVAAKLRDDQFYNMDYYSQVLGVPRPELVAMELCVLEGLGFRLEVSPEDFTDHLEQLVDIDACGNTEWLSHLPLPPCANYLALSQKSESSTQSLS